jgi:hypothetical protein
VLGGVVGGVPGWGVGGVPGGVEGCGGVDWPRASAALSTEAIASRCSGFMVCYGSFEFDSLNRFASIERSVFQMGASVEELSRRIRESQLPFS